MKKIFFIIIAVIVIILFFNMYGTFAYQSNQSKPYIDFKKKIDISQLFDYRDPTYGYTISYPDFFEHEDTSLSNYQSYARFSYIYQLKLIPPTGRIIAHYYRHVPTRWRQSFMPQKL